MLEHDCFSLWLIGPSASGKTTLSKFLYEKLNKNYLNIICIDGDQTRKIFDNNLGYDPKSRSKNTNRYINIVKWLQKYNISSIVSVISPFQKDRLVCRNVINNYFEIYLDCSLDIRIKRDKKKLYLPAIKGEKKFVVDVDIKFEKPDNCDFTLNTEINSPEILSNEIIKKIFKN